MRTKFWFIFSNICTLVLGIVISSATEVFINLMFSERVREQKVIAIAGAAGFCFGVSALFWFGCALALGLLHEEENRWPGTKMLRYRRTLLRRYGVWLGMILFLAVIFLIIACTLLLVSLLVADLSTGVPTSALSYPR